MDAIYAKSLRLPLSSDPESSMGKTITLMSNDAAKLYEAVVGIHFIWLAPICTIVASILLIAEVGMAVLAGLAMIILSFPLQSIIAAAGLRFRQRMLENTGQRLRLIGETLRGIRVVKMYAWEEPLYSMIRKLRDQETASLYKLICLRVRNYDLCFYYISRL